METYFTAFISGTMEPFWPHLILLSVSVLAGIAVGAGIIFESVGYSASVHRIAKWLVISGVAVESLCTIGLFVFDEGISGAQQAKIISLEAEIAPRRLSPDQQQGFTAALWEKFPGKTVRIKSYALDLEAAFLGFQVINALNEAAIMPDDCRLSAAGLGGVTVGISVTGPNKELVGAIIGAFKAQGLRDVSDAPAEGATALGTGCKTPDSDLAATVFIGAKPLPE